MFVLNRLMYDVDFGYVPVLLKQSQKLTVQE